MNRYTKEYHQAAFPGFNKPTLSNETLRNFWHSTQIPFVDIDLKFDHTATYNWLLENDHFFSDVRSQLSEKVKQAKYNQEWYEITRSDGWKGIHVKGNVHKKSTSIQGDESSDDVEVTKIDYAVPDLVRCFEENGLELQCLWVFRLSPGGWLQPHKDLVPPSTPGLAQFWMPLHDFPECLKIYPYGYLKHQVGHLYLFNNPNFVHSAVNQTVKNRYVAFGEINYKALSEQTSSRIRNLLIEQWS
jgi:hypothetical protein